MKHIALLAVLVSLLGSTTYAELPYHNETLIQERLQKCNISNEMKNKHPELVRLILTSESMRGDNERQFWFDKYAQMDEEQINRLFNILDTERKKLEALEERYKNEIKELNERHLNEWKKANEIKDKNKNKNKI